jgi:hypothetical protein
VTAGINLKEVSEVAILFVLVTLLVAVFGTCAIVVSPAFFALVFGTLVFAGVLSAKSA